MKRLFLHANNLLAAIDAPGRAAALTRELLLSGILARRFTPTTRSRAHFSLHNQAHGFSIQNVVLTSWLDKGKLFGECL